MPALFVMGVFVCVGIGLHQSRVWQISFCCSPIVCRLLAGGDWFSAHLHFLVLVVWLFHVWPGLSGVSSWFTVSCVGRLCSACLRGLMDDETSPHFIFLFMLLLIPFHVIGLSIKALLYIYIFIAWGLQKY